MSLRSLLAAALAAPLALGASASLAQDLKCRKIEFIVPFSAGGGTDAMARTLATGIEKASGVTTQVINIVGGDGVVGKREVMGRPADGCSLLAVTLDFVIFEANGVAAANLSEVKPLYRAHVDLGALHAAQGGPIGSWADAKAKATKDKPLLVGGLSSGSFDEAAVNILLGSSGVPYRYIPYDKTGEMHADVMGGRIDVMYEEMSVATPLIAGAKVKPVVIAYDQRIKTAPDVPSAPEAGLTVSPPIWRGAAVHKDTPAASVAALEKLIVEAAKTEGYRDFAQKRGLDLVDGVQLSAEFTKSVEEQRKQFGQAFKGKS